MMPQQSTGTVCFFEEVTTTSTMRGFFIAQSCNAFLSRSVEMLTQIRAVKLYNSFTQNDGSCLIT